MHIPHVHLSRYTTMKLIETTHAEQMHARLPHIRTTLADSLQKHFLLSVALRLTSRIVQPVL